MVLDLVLDLAVIATWGVLLASYVRHRDTLTLILVIVVSLFGLGSVAMTEYRPLAALVLTSPSESLVGKIRDVGPLVVVGAGILAFVVVVLSKLLGPHKADTGSGIRHDD
jgi:purine-cytosine permease-like protein